MADEDARGRSVTVFIDNLPKGTWKVWIYNLFFKFGKIQSIYIPTKKSKISGNQFGFVRMGSSHEATRAVKEMNGLWIWGRTLVANIARFGVQSRREHILIRKNNQTGNKESRGNESRSIVRIQDQLRNLGLAHVLVRHMGGDMVVLTFKDLEERDSMFNKGKMAWLKEWFVESSEWENTNSNPCSRLVWLNCYGIPLHLWNLQTFSEIGKIWGEVIMLADDTMKNLSFAVGKVLISTAVMDSINKVVELENNGRISQIRVMEEQLVVNTVLRTDCACPGCQVEVPSLNQNLDEASVQSPIKMVNGGNARPNLPLIEEVAESANYQLKEIVPFIGSSGYEHTTRGSRLSDYSLAKGRGAATPYLDALMSNLALPNLSVVTPKRIGVEERGVSKEIGEQPEGGHGTTTGDKAKGPSSLPPNSPFGGLWRFILFMLMLMGVLEA
ncbi:hypothetical protein Acr_00g0095870 [Actinidia rufa]|uniref:RRM domain-containing protein n=1 Tax=Actinidia rufa TaxID=165716 RepID=A0A7J0DZ35_9ERIC|nr:hypothetical protein Acr_00g0095870 [Actinidia rufa]